MNKSQSNKPSQLRLSATAVLLALSLTSPVAMPAGLSDMLNEQFNTMSNITMPDVFETQRRGVLSGGSIATRSKIVNTQVVSMVPPGWKAGCGGIDLFAGSFSFINGDQFVQLLRSIASNAAGYAFQVALSTVCEQCMTWISSLQKSMQALNQFAGNSCQLAQGIVNQATDGMDFVDWKGRQGQSLTNMAKGFTTDFLSSWTQSGGESPEETRKNNDPTGYQEEVTGNIVCLCGNLLNDLSAHIFKSVFKLDFLGNGHTIVCNQRAAVGLIKNNVSSFRSKCYSDCIC